MKRFHLAIGAALASLGLLSGCQSCCDPCCCQRQPLLSRLGLCSTCKNGNNGHPVSAMPVSGGPIDAYPANGGCGCSSDGGFPGHGDGPMLGGPPMTIPGAPPMPGPMPLTPTPAAPPLAPVPNGNGGLAQPTPANPSYWRK